MGANLISDKLRNQQQLDDDFMSKVFEDDCACTNAKDMYYEVLADRVHYFKEDEK